MNNQMKHNFEDTLKAFKDRFQRT